MTGVEISGCCIFTGFEMSESVWAHCK